jgi:hypothetical protein
MASTLAPEEYARISAEAYRRRVLAQAREHGTPAADPAQAGERAAVLAIAGQAWADDIGPFYDTDGARIALGGVTKQAVSDRVHRGRLLALRLASDGSGRDRWVYPAWQFRPAVLRHLPAVLDAAGYDPDRATTGWTIATWLVTRDEELGASPLQLLEAGHLPQVREAAREVRASLGVDERAVTQPPATTAS